jgi:hypothetical protein
MKMLMLMPWLLLYNVLRVTPSILQLLLLGQQI